MTTENKTQEQKKEPEKEKNNEVDTQTPAFISGLVSLASSLGITYLAWVKPLQNFLESLEKQTKASSEKITNLEMRLLQMEELLNKQSVNTDEVENDDGNFLISKRSNPHSSVKRRFPNQS
jgi:hypothetical protein